jgi:predicted nucleic acid-binding protein
MSKVYVLDACALIALLNHENGAGKVVFAYKKAEKGEAKIIMNRINLFEVYYGFYRDKGEKYAENVMENVARSSVTINEFDKEIFTVAGRLKASYKFSLADSIVLAQALVTGVELLTADHHEFGIIDGKEPIRFLWIR